MSLFLPGVLPRLLRLLLRCPRSRSGDLARRRLPGGCRDDRVPAAGALDEVGGELAVIGRILLRQLLLPGHRQLAQKDGEEDDMGLLTGWHHGEYPRHQDRRL